MKSQLAGHGGGVRAADEVKQMFTRLRLSRGRLRCVRLVPERLVCHQWILRRSMTGLRQALRLSRFYIEVENALLDWQQQWPPKEFGILDGIPADLCAHLLAGGA